MNRYKFMFYWGIFWAGWCLGALILDVCTGHWFWAATMVGCVVIDVWAAYIGYTRKDNYGKSDS